MPFASLGLAEPLVLAVQEKGYTQPTPIQLQAIPAILAGRDIMAAAQTGTGKTAGFTLPLLQRLLDGPKTKANHARALVLTPTRELAAQVQESVEAYGANLPLRSAVVFGGVSINPQMKSLRRGVDVLVATPGRLLDLHAQNAIRFDQIETLVLDEADRMLDMGFIHDIKKVLALLPKDRQNLLFSATFCAEIRDLARSLLNDPLEVDVAPRNSTAEQVEQVVHPVDKGKKAALLSHLIRSGKWTQAIVFTRTKHGANKLVEYLHRDEISAAAIHSNKSQGARTRALADFKGGDISILVATDIAARGLDIPQLPQVVNFDLPNVPEDYVHRIGRTGRAGETGHAISLVDAEEAQQLWDIERLIKRQIPRQIMADFEPAQPLPEGKPSQGKKAGPHPHSRRPQQARKPGQQGQRPQGQGGQQNRGGQQGERQQAERAQGQQAGRHHQGQPRNNNRRNPQSNQDNFGNLESYGNRSQQHKPRSQGQGQGQRMSHVDKALMGSPMSQRFDSHEEHRRAQALGNRIVPDHELQRTKRSQSPKQHPQQSFHSPSYGNGNGNSNGNGNGHKRQGQNRNQPRPQGAGARKPRNPQGSGHHQGRNWTPRPDA